MKRCTICANANITEINQLLIQGTSYRDISGRFRTSKSAIERHRAGCLPAHLLKAQESEEILDANGLMARLRGLERDTRAILNEERSTVKHAKCPKCGEEIALKGGNNDIALKAIGRIETQLKLSAELAGLLIKRLDHRLSFREALEHATTEEVAALLTEMETRRAAAKEARLVQ